MKKIDPAVAKAFWCCGEEGRLHMTVETRRGRFTRNVCFICGKICEIRKTFYPGELRQPLSPNANYADAWRREQHLQWVMEGLATNHARCRD
jgi:hypothetical protein